MIATPPRHGRNGRRAIVNIASINSEHASTNRGEYCISKAGVSMMTSLFALRSRRTASPSTRSGRASSAPT